MVVSQLSVLLSGQRRWWAMGLLALVSVFLSLGFGSANIEQVWSCLIGSCSDPLQQMIFFDIRLPRVIAGFMVGAGLAVAGSALQNVTRNGLADPYLFGVVAGAGLGASVVTMLPIMLDWPDVGVRASVALPVGAFTGALLAVLMVQGLAVSALARSTEQLLLAGVAISLMLGALTHLILFIGEPFAANQVLFWLMGSLSRIEPVNLYVIAPVVMIGSAVLLVLGHRLDALLLGDDNAFNLGVNATSLRSLTLVLCAGLTAVIVTYCGGIGFVGLMVPHIVRQWFGVTSRTLIVGCWLCGGTFLVWVDVIARSIVTGQEIPIGIITSAIGSMFFLLVMRQQRS
ncbi:FecCD family ABC transporter permease [Parathalassolituus penaei]|uniref:Iron ABC transporter permease n=1 Tax=Parathalassolituus penaei TaxID=2997323 RepID=A0A9X3EPZ3_9GAMM|nr:iron ABC transporter permease [Parathalassolituus penaei]MCY0966733.1 iron ABC transporter permease [Parathalassolituus penaei]